MPDDRAPWESAFASGRPDPSAEELAELRELLLGPERRRLKELEQRLDAVGMSGDELAELLPEAIALRSGRDRQLARALAPTIEGAIGESVRRNPREIASAIFPVLGPAIRKAIAETLAGLVASINSTIEHSLSPRGLRWRVEAWRSRSRIRPIARVSSRNMQPVMIRWAWRALRSAAPSTMADIRA